MFCSTFRLTVGVLLSGVLLAACTREPQPVHYFAEGRPARFSDWNVLLDDGDWLRLNQDVVPYDLNTPLFSDYAHKLRTIWLPKGSSAKYDGSATFDFPVGTVITKTFYYPLPAAGQRDGKSVARTYDTATDFAGTSLDKRQVRLIETRVLVRREQGWDAIPYVWNARQTDAELARTGDQFALELVADDGSREPFTYVTPNENQCAGCHVIDLNAKQIAPIGPKARHLNRDFAYADGAENQISHWSRLGLLSGAPGAASRRATPIGATPDSRWRRVPAPTSTSIAAIATTRPDRPTRPRCSSKPVFRPTATWACASPPSPLVAAPAITSSISCPANPMTPSCPTAWHRTKPA